MLLLNRSPLLEDLSTAALAALRVHPAMSGQWAKDLHGVHRAVAALGHADPPPLRGMTGPAAIEGVAATWAAWVERWHATSTLTPDIRRGYRSVLAKIGRWLTAEHPEITEPGQWTRQTCASWVAAVDRMTVGDFSQWTARHALAGSHRQAAHAADEVRLPQSAPRVLPRPARMGWIPRRFDPAHALRTPRSVRPCSAPTRA